LIYDIYYSQFYYLIYLLFIIVKWVQKDVETLCNLLNNNNSNNNNNNNNIFFKLNFVE